MRYNAMTMADVMTIGKIDVVMEKVMDRSSVSEPSDLIVSSIPVLCFTRNG